ncbi:MAG: bifunctional 4-hydroxy-3-methylbut-2-enyl diphosphate reductase/30S ribosomal protein S1 [Oscillospiraceae bacterium]|nr:bifunctional 4-hydroxy-3-methylbut-2-enyl diphosphate reductase/30S ribosomal protein S1 [Oscillospiraceae bacterium]
MSVTVAKTAGFCFGVKRAVLGVYNAIDEGRKIATLGDIIHNRQVTDDLEAKGVYAYERVEDIPQDHEIVIRAHGVGKDVYEKIKDRPYTDLTCPFVEKIHKIVEKYHEEGYKIVIVGDETHPEVIGINGWCDYKAVIIDSEATEISIDFGKKPICVVAQTTIKKNNFVQIVQILKNTCKSTIEFDTICSATKNRQSEAAGLAAESDCMIVIGGRKSSNTKKLFEICKSACTETYHVETAEEIPQKQYNKIGITAGASTPARIIQEVVKAMSENLKNEESFAELFESYEQKTLNNGDIVDGQVVEIRKNEVIVDLGGFKYNGQLAADQITDDPSLEPSDVVKEGDTIRVYVVGVNDAEGKVVLSRKKLVAMESWNKIKAAYESGDVLEGKIIKAVKGGVIALTDGSQVFIPARQASERYVSDLQSLVGTTLKFKLIELDERRKRVVGSARVILEAERKAKEDAFWAAAEVGKHYTGTVKSLTSFGAFVDIGGVDGLVHISELSWNKIKHPSEVCAVGDVMDVYIKDINAETKKISLGFKKLEDNPWVIAENKINVGDVITAKIVRMMPFGAFAEIIPTVDGLIHISQIADRRIGKPEDVLSIGQEVEVKVTDAKWDEKKISLSIRALIEKPEEAPAEEAAEEPEEDDVQPESTLVYSTDPEVEVVAEPSDAE